jgi:hypothetical protein
MRPSNQEVPVELGVPVVCHSSLTRSHNYGHQPGSKENDLTKLAIA